MKPKLVSAFRKTRNIDSYHARAKYGRAEFGVIILVFDSSGSHELNKLKKAMSKKCETLFQNWADVEKDFFERCNNLLKELRFVSTSDTLRKEQLVICSIQLNSDPEFGDNFDVLVQVPGVLPKGDYVNYMNDFDFSDGDVEIRSDEG